MSRCRDGEVILDRCGIVVVLEPGARVLRGRSVLKLQPIGIEAVDLANDFRSQSFRQRIDAFFRARFEPNDEFVPDGVAPGIGLWFLRNWYQLGRVVNRVAVDEQPGGAVGLGKQGKVQFTQQTPECLGRFESVEPARGGVFRVRLKIDLPAGRGGNGLEHFWQRPRFDLGVNLVPIRSPNQRVGRPARVACPQPNRQGQPGDRA